MVVVDHKGWNMSIKLSDFLKQHNLKLDILCYPGEGWSNTNFVCEAIILGLNNTNRGFGNTPTKAIRALISNIEGREFSAHFGEHRKIVNVPDNITLSWNLTNRYKKYTKRFIRKPKIQS